MGGTDARALLPSLPVPALQTELLGLLHGYD